ncbi:hypothetical protein J6590_005079 [Homalodisca vitripennis]|nr:hypothetical protein J6590_005079 [Homalodisca vitripennis]
MTSLFFANLTNHKMISDYKGGLNMFYGDALLRRSHFTNHGLHYNQSGKAVLGKHVTDLTSMCIAEALFTPAEIAQVVSPLSPRQSSTVEREFSEVNDKNIHTLNSYLQHENWVDVIDTPDFNVAFKMPVLNAQKK